MNPKRGMNILPEDNNIKGLLKEYAKNGRSIEEEQVYDEIRRLADRVYPLSHFSSTGLPAFICRKLFDYYLLESYSLREKKVFDKKKNMYEYLRTLSKKESAKNNNQEVKATEAFDELDRIYESL